MTPPFRAATVCVAAVLLLGGPVATAGDDGATRVLFIGNSLTAANDLPAMVAALADGAGHRLEVGVVTAPGFALEDHWRGGRALQAIDSGDWNLVVLQQGPSSLPDSRRHLRRWTRRFARRIREAGAEPALLMVWPSRARLAVFDDVRDSYASAADAVDGLFLPAGEAWRAAWERSPDLGLYGEDEFHPSPLGSLVAAAAVTRALVGELPEDLTVAVGGLDAETARLVREAALDTARAEGPAAPTATAPASPDRGS